MYVCLSIQLLCSCLSSSANPTISELAKAEELEEEAREREAAIEAAVNIINTDLCARVKGLQPTAQADIDNLVM